jgi:tetratricopeptide (TPR) repeat protein
LRAALQSPTLGSYARQFVWLDVNYDEPRNGPFLADHVAGTPMLLVMEPASGTVLDVWTGSATPEQLAAIFAHALAPPGDQADIALRRGDALVGRNEFVNAVTAYEQALAAGGPSWHGRWHATEQLLGALSGRPRACADRAEAEAPKMPREHPFVSVALVGMQCLQGEPSLIGTPEGDRLEALAAEALALPSASEDEHYMMYEVMYAIRTQAGDKARARAIADAYMAYVEHLPPPASDDERRARDQTKLRAAIKLGTPEHVIPLLEATDRELPDDNAANRLAAAYNAANRFGDTIAAATRGLSRHPGPSGTVRLLVARATAEAGLKDIAAARRDLELALKTSGDVTAGQLRDAQQAQIHHQLDALAKPS